ncbi:MAG: lipopolysaccharide/colanic/teichoic acid biosynthesis glycosyltransferase [Bacteroidia bacterium]
MKRLFDIVASLFGLMMLFPVFIIISILVIVDSGFPIFYRQTRVGRNNVDFRLWKFRSMHTDADKRGLLTVGDRDPRITRMGFFLRKTKLDELPQLINVLVGDMSLVGPRPEVRRYVDYYNDEQMRVLSIRPGITDNASIKFRNETEILASQDDPEQYYIDHILPEKTALYLKYVDSRSFLGDLKMILNTLVAIIRS